MKTEGGWGFPFAMERMIPRNTMMASVERNTETGTGTNAAREERWSNSWRHEANLGRTIYHRRQPSYWSLGKQKMSKRRKLWCWAENFRARAIGDRWSEGTPPRIETAQVGNRDTRQSRQSQEVSSEVWENRGAKRRRDKREEEEILTWRPGIMRLEEETHWIYRKMREMIGFTEKCR